MGYLLPFLCSYLFLLTITAWALWSRNKWHSLCCGPINVSARDQKLNSQMWIYLRVIKERAVNHAEACSCGCCTRLYESIERFESTYKTEKLLIDLTQEKTC